MSWSLSYDPPKDGEHLDDYLLAIGKALYIATEFEAKCSYLLQLITVVDTYHRTQDAAQSLSVVVRSKFLGNTINNLQESKYVEDADIEVLNRARAARNYIAHESTRIGPIYTITSDELQKRFQQLRESLTDLSIGDNLVSQWLYEIQEKQHAPKAILEQYVDKVLGWALGTGRPHLTERRM